MIYYLQHNFHSMRILFFRNPGAAGYIVALFLAGSPAKAESSSKALIQQAIAKAVFQTAQPDSVGLSDSDFQDLTMVIGLKDGKAAFENGAGVFSFLTGEPVPTFSEKSCNDPEVSKRFRILDARKSAAVTWLVSHGAAKEMLAAAAGETRAKTLGELLQAAAQSSGSQATKEILELAGNQAIPEDFSHEALLGAVRNAWLFPETVNALVEAGVSCDPDSGKDSDALLALLQNFSSSDSAADKNTAEALNSILKKTRVISADAMKYAIAAGWTGVVERFLAADSKPDTETCMEWLVAAKLRNNNYSEAEFAKLKQLFTAIQNKEAEVVKNLPSIRAYFVGKDDEHGEEPWVTDGTAVGTRLLADVNPGQKGSYARILGESSGGLLMVGSTEGDVRRLQSLRSGQSESVTTLVTEMKEIDGSSVAEGGLVVWKQGSSVWQSDGTAAGTTAVAAGKLHFTEFGSQNGRILVQASPIHDKNFQVKQNGGGFIYLLLPTQRRLVPLCWDTNNYLAVSGDQRCFVGNRLYASNGGNLWVGPPIDLDKPQGQTDAPSILLEHRLTADLSRGAAAQLGQYFYFCGDSRKEVAKGKSVSVFGRELFRTDGTPAGTSLVADIREQVQDTVGSNPDSFFVLGNKLLFLADDGKHGRRLWSFDGEGTRMLHESAVHTNGTFVAFDSKAYFVYGTQLWSTDGTPTGTVSVREFDATPKRLTCAGSCLVFSVGDALWRSDGTAQGCLKFAEAVVVSNGFVPGKPAMERVSEQSGPSTPTHAENEKLPEKIFKPTPLGGE